MPTVTLKYLSFHPSIWPRMIGDVSRDAMPGSLVEVFGTQGTTFGWGLWNPKARMPLRMVSHRPEPIDESFFLDAIRNAASLRREMFHLDEETDSYRCIHADADFLPGLVADKFGDVMSLEVTTLAAWQRLNDWLPLIHECFGTKRTVVRIDAQLAQVEGIPRGPHPASENIRNVKIREHGITYEVDFTDGHKTGFFCDQRDNRKRFGQLAKGKDVLDLCCYTGGFSVSAALGGASEVTAVDLDETAVAMAKRNANLNNARVKFTHADAFTWMRTMIENGRQWDLVIADPPKFIFGQDDETGHAKYNDLNKLAVQLVKPGGIFVTCSCSGMLAAEAFEKVVIAVSHRQSKRLQIVNRTGAGPDHPELSNYPESRYLKVLWSRVW